MSLCVDLSFIFYLIVCCFSVIWVLLPKINVIDGLPKHVSIITRFSVNIVRNTFLKPSLSILFLLLRFPLLQSGAAISTPAISTPAFSDSPQRALYTPIGQSLRAYVYNIIAVVV